MGGYLFQHWGYSGLAVSCAGLTLVALGLLFTFTSIDHNEIIELGENGVEVVKKEPKRE